MGNDEKVISNFIWRFMERCGAQLVSLIISIILARLLDPSAYGTVALITVIMTILQVFIDSGLGSALIQKKDADDLDFSSVFYFNLFVCSFLYVGVFFFAPLIAFFYEKSEMIPLIRVLGIVLIISGLKNIQIAYVSRNMQFKKFFFATLVGIIGSAIIGIVMAYRGYGVWALVVQNLSNTFIDTVVLWITVKWRPQFQFSLARLKKLWDFGWKLLVSNLASTVYSNIRQLLVGKYYSEQDLAYYNKGHEFPAKIVPNVVTAINSVLLPTMSAEQDDITKIRNMTARSSKIAAFVIWPAMIGLAACGESMIVMLLTEKWLPALPFLWVFCIDCALWPTIYTGNNAITAIGRSDIYLKIQVVQKLLGILILVITFKMSVIAIAIGVLLTTMIELFLTGFYIKRLLDYSFKKQIASVLPSAILSLIMGVCVYFLGYLNIATVWKLIVQIMFGMMIYLIGAYLFKFESFYYLFRVMGTLLKKKRG